MTGSANCDIVSKGRRDLFGVKCIGVFVMVKKYDARNHLTREKSRDRRASKVVRKVARCVLARNNPRKTPNPFAMMSPWENVRYSLNV